VFLRLSTAGRVAAPVTLILGLLLGAQPAFADTELGHTGTVGVHSLVDTTNNGGAFCFYNHPYGTSQLKSIEVTPPRMKALNGQSAQKVGWRAIVQRKFGSIYTNNAWIDKFTSAEFTAIANDASYVSVWYPAAISVTVPYGPNAQGQLAQYRVFVKMIWHTPNGQVQGTALHRVDHYNKNFGGWGGIPTVHQNGNCEAYWYH
jgi:hypothetical protein